MSQVYEMRVRCRCGKYGFVPLHVATDCRPSAASLHKRGEVRLMGYECEKCGEPQPRLISLAPGYKPVPDLTAEPIWF